MIDSRIKIAYNYIKKESFIIDILTIFACFFILFNNIFLDIKQFLIFSLFLKKIYTINIYCEMKRTLNTILKSKIVITL